MRFAPMAVLGPCLVGCGAVEDVGVRALGRGLHDGAGLEIQVVATSADGLDRPTDLAFNPNDPTTLWVTNLGDDSITVFEGPELEAVFTSSGFGREHFLARPSSLAFADSGRFATAQDTDELTQGTATPEDFMGPTLWDDSARFHGGHAGHLDMLHNSPLGGGIAWEADAAYWIFDGYHASITRYDFAADHGYGGSDHTDGVVSRYVEGEVDRDPGTPSHLAYDADTTLLYVADTRNGRVAVLDTATGTRGGPIVPNYDGSDQHHMDGAELWSLVEGEAVDVAPDAGGAPSIEASPLTRPSGLELANGLLWVTDTRTSRVLAYDRDGVLLDWVQLDRPPGSLGGVTLDADGRVLVVDREADELLRLVPLDD